MRPMGLILSLIAFGAMSPKAYAASSMLSCFETAAEANMFVSNVKAHEKSYHKNEQNRREVLGQQNLSYSSLRYILGDSQNISLSEPQPDDTVNSTTLSQYIIHKHLAPEEAERSDKGQYCSKTWSEIHVYRDVWTVDIEKNLVLTSHTFTDIAR